MLPQNLGAAEVRDFVREALTGERFDVLTARNGADGLAVIGGREDWIDVVVTDVVMPGMDGPAMIEHLRIKRPDLRVVFMTGYGDNARLSRAMRGNGAVLLEKPVSVEALTAAVNRVIGRRPVPV